MSEYRDTPTAELLDWTNPDKLMELWRRADIHPRITAKELKITAYSLRSLKNKAANYATYLRLKSEGKNKEAQKYLNIYRIICRE